MIALRLWWRLAKRQDSSRLVIGLALIAFGAATGALLTVIGGLRAFVGRAVPSTGSSAGPSTGSGNGDVYVMLAQVATVILVVPVLTLGGAAARLAVARRDERLAALRLAGATSGQVGVMAVADAAAQAMVGALLGVLLYLIALPGVALINFQGRTFAWSELWVGPGILILVVIGVVLLAVVSAVMGLTKIIVSPLGVARRVTPKKLSWIRVAIAAVVLAAWTPVFNSSGGKEITFLLVFFGICFGILNLLGPFVLGLIGRLSARRAKSVPRLLAARRLIDDPKSAWRTVGGVTLATFVAGVLSIAPAISEATANDPNGEFLPVDMMTGAIVTLIIAALLSAVSSGVTQAARILDQRVQYRALHHAGTDISVLEKTRLAETWLPLVASVSIAVGVSLIMIAPFGIMLVAGGSLGLLMFAGGVVVSLAMVMAAVRLSQPMVATVIAV